MHSTNNFPEFTGRICPAPCEAACTLNVNDDAVGIKSIEHAIIDRAWAEGWVLAQPPKVKTGKSVAVVGSGPAGMMTAAQLSMFPNIVSRVIERRDGRLVIGQADGVQARAVETFQAFGFATLLYVASIALIEVLGQLIARSKWYRQGVV